jgi:hypothetical protein
MIDRAVLDRGIQLREERGRSCARIARVLGGTQSAWEWRFLSAGAFSPRQVGRQAPSRLKPYRRGDTIVRPFTIAEDAKIEAARMGGMTLAAIGRQQNPPRSAVTVQARLLTLARKREISLGARREGDA